MTTTLGIFQAKSVDPLPPILQMIPEAIDKNIAARSRREATRSLWTASGSLPAMTAGIAFQTALHCFPIASRMAAR